MTTHQVQEAGSEGTPLKQLIGAEDLCKRLDISARHLRNLVQFRRIPHTKVGGLVKFYEEDIAEWLERNRRGIHS